MQSKPWTHSLDRLYANSRTTIVDLPSGYGVSSTFNVIDLSSCDVGVLDAHPRIDSFQ